MGALPTNGAPSSPDGQTSRADGDPNPGDEPGRLMRACFAECLQSASAAVGAQVQLAAQSALRVRSTGVEATAATRPASDEASVWTSRPSPKTSALMRICLKES